VTQCPKMYADHTNYIGEARAEETWSKSLWVFRFFYIHNFKHISFLRIVRPSVGTWLCRFVIFSVLINVVWCVLPIRVSLGHIPALLIRMSTPSRFVFTQPNALCSSVSLVTSHLIGYSFPVSDLRDAASSCTDNEIKPHVYNCLMR
jgi:hypothetical protein